jgi:uncharacterized protein YycO
MKKAGAIAMAIFVLAGLGLHPVAAWDLIGKIIGVDPNQTWEHPYPTGLKVGDIVIGHNPVSDVIIPGYWTHTGMIAYYDSNKGEWMVVEAYDDPSQVRLVTLSDFLKRYDEVAVLRVRTTDDIRQKAVNFALAQLGKPYDYLWFMKEVYGDSYYCSELVWASYKAVGGPDLDANPGFNLKYLDGVAPQEIYDDGDTYVIYQHHA